MVESIRVAATPEQLGAVHDALARFWGAVDRGRWRSLGDTARLQFATAVGEIAGNIVRHAHPVGSEVGTIEIEFCAYADRVEARFRDRGLVYKDVPRPTKDLGAVDAMELPESGFGLFVARAALDRLQYHRTRRGTNHWHLVKRVES